MPAQQRVGRDRGDLAQRAPTDADGADGEPTPIGVRQPDSSRPELPTEQPVFDDQVGDDFAFAVLEPIGEHQEQPLESRGVERERQLTSRARHVDRMLGHYGRLCDTEGRTAACR